MREGILPQIRIVLSNPPLGIIAKPYVEQPRRIPKNINPKHKLGR